MLKEPEAKQLGSFLWKEIELEPACAWLILYNMFYYRSYKLGLWAPKSNITKNITNQGKLMPALVYFTITACQTLPLPLNPLLLRGSVGTGVIRLLGWDLKLSHTLGFHPFNTTGESHRFLANFCLPQVVEGQLQVYSFSLIQLVQ